MSKINHDRLNRGIRAATWCGSKWCAPALRQAIYLRDKRKCVLCGALESDRVKLSLDHVIPQSAGGTDFASNLLTLCCRCNFSKQDKSLTEFIDFLGIDRRNALARVRAALARSIDLQAGAQAENARKIKRKDQEISELFLKGKSAPRRGKMMPFDWVD